MTWQPLAKAGLDVHYPRPGPDLWRRRISPSIHCRAETRPRKRPNSDVYLMDADRKGEAKPLAHDPYADEQNPSWSPSGDEIAYENNAKTAAWPGPPLDRVWAMNSNGENQRVSWSSGGTEPSAS